MNLPLVMPTNLNKLALKLESKHPGRMGLLLSPEVWCDPLSLPFALDNGRFSVWARGKVWREEDFENHLVRAKRVGREPLWLVVPDVVGKGEETLREWHKRRKKLSSLGIPLALAVQDGMKQREILRLHPLPEVIFLGGSTYWKWSTLRSWCKNFPRVHVGRVNTGKLLWACHEAGAESSDGTGWWHHIQKNQLERYLERSGKGLSRFPFSGFLNPS